MITKENLEEINKDLSTIPVKGKDYVTVDARVRAFRKLIPDGTISTEILSNENGVVTMKATIQDETGRILSTGLSYEKESNGFINKTSYIENCETSAVGRALGFLGIGINTSIASAEDVGNAVENQPIDAVKVKIIRQDIEKGKTDEEKLLKWLKIKRVEDMTEGMFRKYAEKKEEKK